MWNLIYVFIGKLEEISELVSSCLPSPIRREKLAVAIENEGYIKKLLGLFHICEDLENTEGLHHLYEIFKNIFLLNKNALFELMFAEDTIFDVVSTLSTGCLREDYTSLLQSFIVEMYNLHVNTLYVILCLNLCPPLEYKNINNHNFFTKDTKVLKEHT